MELKKVDFLLIVQILSTLLRMYGVSLIVPSLVAFYLGDPSAAKSFFTTGLVIFGITSILLFLLEKPLKDHEAKIKHTVICLALAWIVVSFISMIPFLREGLTTVDAFFESFSGWTGSGLSMINDPASVTPSLNFFRGYIQWIGGFGIVVLALLLYTRPTTAKSLFMAEGRSENFFLDFKKIARIVVAIFAVYTVAGIVALKISGVPLFHAIIHALTTISTGGFSSNTIGIGVYGYVPMFIGILLMLIGAISFNSHYHLLSGDYKKFFKNPEIIFMIAIIFISTALISFEIWFIEANFFYDGFFYVVSALSGAGAGTPVPISSFNQVSIIIFIFLMVCGATYGSTAGAVKLWRILIVGKIIRREVVKHFLPEHAVVPIKVGDQVVSDDQALKVTAYTLLYLSVLFIGSFIFMLSGYTTVNSVFMVASAQGNVGLNILSEATYFGMNTFLKMLLVFHMLIGRIEIFPLLVLIRSFTAKK